MPIVFARSLVRFTDAVGVEDAETLLEWVQQHPTAEADLESCTHLHPANLQVLLAAHVAVRAWPADAEFARWLATVLSASPRATDLSSGDIAA
jgi:hypothetical protein